MKKIHILPLLLLFSIFVDFSSTYYFTPDLKNEANLFVVKYDFGWTGLLIAVLSLDFITVGLYYYHALFFKYKIVHIKPSTFKSYYDFCLNHNYDTLFYQKCRYSHYLRFIANIGGFFWIRIVIVQKLFFAFGNTLNGLSIRYYKYVLISQNTNEQVYKVTPTKSPFAKDSFIEQIIINWVLNEATIEDVWFNTFIVCFIFILLAIFIKKEKHKVDVSILM